MKIRELPPIEGINRHTPIVGIGEAGGGLLTIADIANVLSVADSSVFYVDRQFSNESEMLAQDAAALQGVANRPFATPYSAKKAAIAWMDANPTKQAIVEIQRGNAFTSADYSSSLHDVTVSMGGVNYVSGVELTFHGITYVAYGSIITTPLTNAAFIIGQVLNGLAAKKAVFYGGMFTDAGFNSTANANIYFLDTESLSPSPSRHTDRFVTYDAGLKFLKVANLSSGLMIGDKWTTAPEAGNSKVSENLVYIVGEITQGRAGYSPISITKLHEKNVCISIDRAYSRRLLLSLGHYSGTTNASTPENPLLGGCDNSVVSVKLGTVVPTDYIYSADIGGGYINCPNNRNSRFNVELGDLGVTTVPKLMWIYGTQENNQYHYKGAKIKINNVDSVEMPFNLSLATSVLVLENWDIQSNVNSALFTVGDGKLVLRNCMIRQTSNNPVFGISAGAKVVLENTHIVGHASSTLTSGVGKIISKNSTSNVPVGTAVLAGNLTVSADFDEQL